MPTINVIHVTNELSSGTGSLQWAYDKAIDTGDPDYESIAQIVIDNGVDAIPLMGTVIDNNPVSLSILDIVTEDDHIVTLAPDGMSMGGFRFMDYFTNNGLNFSFENLVFDGFSAVASGGDAGNGGTIRAIGPVTLTNCTFDESEADGSGGAIYTESELTVTDCAFTFNAAADDGGAIYSIPEGSAQGITVTDSVFLSNTATSGSGGAIYFYTSAGTLGIYGDTTLFDSNFAFTGQGGGVYQHGGTIEAISSGSADPDASGFLFNDDDGSGTQLYLIDLAYAHIDIVVTAALIAPGPIAIYLHSSTPPILNYYWSDINVDRVFGGDDAIDSNWPY